MYESWERNYNVMTIIDPFSHHDLKSFGTYHNQKQQRSDESQPSIGGDASCKLQLVADQSDNSSSNGISSLTQENACNTVLLSPSSVRFLDLNLSRLLDQILNTHTHTLVHDHQSRHQARG